MKQPENSAHPAVAEMREAMPVCFAMMENRWNFEKGRIDMAGLATPKEVAAARAASDIDLTDMDTLEVMPEEDWKANVARQRAECAEFEAAAKKRAEEMFSAQVELRKYLEMIREKPLTSNEIMITGVAMLTLAEPEDMTGQDADDLLLAAKDYCQRYLACWAKRRGPEAA
jgi:hypothetical protein